jgi:DNA-binding protein HU-beta
MSKQRRPADVRSDYDFLDRPRTRYHGDAAAVEVDGVKLDLNTVPDAFARSGSSRTMTKAEFVDRVAQESGLSKKSARAAVDAIIVSIEDTLRAGDEVTFTGFGKFHVAERGAREVRNPRTGEAMRIAASRIPRFTAGSMLKKRVA